MNLDEHDWRSDLAWFAHEASKQGEIWYPYKWLAHLSRILKKSVIRGNARIVVNAPPRHGKSELVSHWLPVWFLDMDPTNRVIVGSYGESLSMLWGRKVRNEFLYNEKLLSKVAMDSKSVTNWSLVGDGGLVAVGVGSGITGRGGNLIVVDDAHKSFEEAMSPRARQRVVDWFNGTLYTRKEPNASIVVIQTRWHEDDLSGYLLTEHADDWLHLNYPAIAEENDILGRTPGEVLCPERWPLPVLKGIEKSMGSWAFAGQYQQRPAPVSGGMIKKEWFKYWWRERLPEMDEYVQSWDLTFKATGTSHVVGQVWGRKGANFYLLDQLRGKWGFVEQVQAIQTMHEKWPQAVTKLIEDTADAQAVKATLENIVPGIVLLPAKGSKEARLSSVLGMVESGNVYLPMSANWLEQFMFEVTTFPFSANDDQVDAMTQALTRLGKKSKVTEFSLPIENGTRGAPWDFANASIF